MMNIGSSGLCCSGGAAAPLRPRLPSGSALVGGPMALHGLVPHGRIASLPYQLQREHQRDNNSRLPLASSTGSSAAVDVEVRGPLPAPLARPHAETDIAVTAAAPAAAGPNEEEEEAAWQAMDGNEAAARMAYLLTDISFIYPITPSTPMSEITELWAAQGKTNIFGDIPSVTEMEGEMGVAGALHGAAATGSLATSFTCSQGLLLMVPNMFKLAGELCPAVLHVAARALSKHAVSMYADHQDVMAVRQTGWAMLCSNCVQEAQDLALVAHLSSLRASLPFLHFFDGFRTSHEINKISVIPRRDVQRLVEGEVYQQAIQRHRDQGVNPTHPNQRGTAQGNDIYFQVAEAANPFFQDCPQHVQAAMDDVAAITGRPLDLFQYVGHLQADSVIIMMGSACEAAEEAVLYLNAQGQRVGLIKVRLFRPWSTRHLLAALPVSASRVAVLDRTKEAGSAGEPLYLDVAATLAEADDLNSNGARRRVVIGGRYGLAGKELTPGMVAGVFANLALPTPKRRFTVGIIDDVSFSSLPPAPELHTLPPGTKQCMFWGLGSDGTVGANKEAVKIIADSTGLYTQAYFAYDAHKSGGLTVSHLRFSPSPLSSSYLIKQADYLAVHHASYMLRYDVLSSLRPGGLLVLNTSCSDVKQLEAFLPNKVKRQLSQLQPQLYVIDALALAQSLGLGRHVNMVMQAVFFRISGLLPLELALELLKRSIAKTYGGKGEEVVAQNQAAVDMTIQQLQPIALPATWAELPVEALPMQLPPSPLLGSTQPPQAQAQAQAQAPSQAQARLRYIQEVVQPMLSLQGDSLPVSVFSPAGIMPPGTSSVERRSIAETIPSWSGGACSQCNVCAFICPHAAIRPFLLDGDAAGAAAPSSFATAAARGAGTAGYAYRMQVSPLDCTGCQLCINACPDHALSPVPLEAARVTEELNWSYALQLPHVQPQGLSRSSVKGSQFVTPLLEFSGACEGCGETAYIKLLTQLFGERLVIANASGCSSVWGGHTPSNPFTTDSHGQGPAWASSLFEDNAQFGMGIALAGIQRRRALHRHVEEVLAKGEEVPLSQELRGRLSEWRESWQQPDPGSALAQGISSLLEAERHAHPALEGLWQQRDQLVRPCIWIVGGDGWAYDIGFGGLDHVLCSGENINILVLDNELYANTGGQMSKSTPLGAVAKFAAGGKQRPKKDLGAIAMTYGDVYVASTNLEANYAQVVKSMSEAERYPGVSLLLCYVPCITHGIKQGMSGAATDAREATQSTYWPLYRYNPDALEDQLHQRFQLDSKKATKDLTSFTEREQRFCSLEAQAPGTAHRLHHDLELMNQERLARFKMLTETGSAAPPHGLHQVEEQEGRAHPA